MRNQFFGDVNDYVKYGLLRAICDPQQLPVAVCWMLTPDGGEGHGQRTGYLSEPEVWHYVDPSLYDSLGLAVRGGQRDVTWAREHHLLPGAVYQEGSISPGGPERKVYFSELWRMAGQAQLVFFDPDRGIEVPSVPYGTKASPKYIYWPELRETYKRGISVLIYQHYPRRPHDLFAAEMIAALGKQLEALSVWGYSTNNVLFLLAAQPHHAELVARRSQQFAMRWGPYVRVIAPSARP